MLQLLLPSPVLRGACGGGAVVVVVVVKVVVGE